jgi:cytochrome P450
MKAMERPTHVPEHLVVDFDVFGDIQIHEVQELARQWRAEKGPIVWTPHHGGCWIVIGAEEVRHGLTDTTIFDSASRGVKLAAIDKRERLIPIELDGPEHAAYRRILNPLFSPARTKLLEDDARKVANELLDKFHTAGRVDVTSQYARPLASSMFLSLVDWPLEDREQLEHWVELELNGIPGQTMEENQATQAQAMADIAAYCMKQIKLRQAEPRDDMTMMLMEAEIDGEKIPESGLVGLLMLLMIAGLDTTQSVTSQGIEAFAMEPARQEYLREDPSRIPMIVEEVLRWTAPAGPYRAAVRDTELAGVFIRKGDRINFMSQVANRDPREFDNPDEIHFDREVNRHMSFGLGPHKCIGAALARVLLVSAFDEFHKRIPTYWLAKSSSHLGGVWGMDEVVIEWGAASR